MPSSDFLKRFARRAPLLCAGPTSRLTPLLGNGVVDKAGLKRLIPKYSGPIHRVDFDDEGFLCFRTLRGARLRGITRHRSACYFLNDYQDHFNEVHSACDALCGALGYSTRGASCQGSLQTAGALVPRHCDNADVLILQLFGTRSWRIERNSDPPKGLHRHVRLPDKLRDGWSAEFRADSPVVTLNPGSALYVPLGWWHETRSDGDSFALTFSIFPPGRTKAAK